MRTSSASRTPRSAGRSVSTRRCFFAASERTVVSTRRMSAAGSNGRRSSSTLPASTLERSSTSFTMSRRCSPPSRIHRRYSRCFAVRLSPPCSSMSWLKPRMEFSGVRSSWLMSARNLLFARLAASAVALACQSCSSIALRSVMSSLTAEVMRDRPVRRRGWRRWPPAPSTAPRSSCGCTAPPATPAPPRWSATGHGRPSGCWMPDFQ